MSELKIPRYDELPKTKEELSLRKYITASTLEMVVEELQKTIDKALRRATLEDFCIDECYIVIHQFEKGGPLETECTWEKITSSLAIIREELRIIYEEFGYRINEVEAPGEPLNKLVIKIKKF